MKNWTIFDVIKFKTRVSWQYLYFFLFNSEGNLFLLEFIHILIINAQFLKFIQFSSLNALNLFSFVLNLLSNLFTFLEVVKSILLLKRLISWNLLSNLFGVINKSLSLLFFNFLFLSFILLLSLNLVHVILSLNSSLFSESGLLLRELLLSSLFKISHYAKSLLVLKLLSFSSLSLTFLESSLGSKSINFCLSISSLLL